jgi:PIN domain nuclease of toxin-antitoxin system
VKLLLDTHIWLWSLLEPDRLAAPVRNALAASSSEVWLSPISVWETLVLAERGRVVLDGTPAAWVERALNAAPLREAALTHAVAVESRAIRLAHQDPADRFLVATARVYGLTLVTADKRLLRAKAVATLANR